MGLSILRSKIQDFKNFDVGYSDWFLITQEQINAFADTTLDHQFIHVDEQKAKTGPFGTTIAHGFLTLSMIPHLIEKLSPKISGTNTVVNYGFNKLRFIAPVKSNSRVRAQIQIIDIENKNDEKFQIRLNVILQIENESKPAFLAEWVILNL